MSEYHRESVDDEHDCRVSSVIPGLLGRLDGISGQLTTFDGSVPKSHDASPTYIGLQYAETF